MNLNHMKLVWLIWTTFGVMVLGVYGLAQDKTTDNMQAARDKLQADKKLFVTEHMKLTDSESKVFWPVYNSYQKEMGIVNDRLAKLIQDYASHYADMTNEEAKKLIDDSLAIDADRLKIRRSYLPQFRQVLPEIKVARYYQIENKIQAAINYDLSTGIRLAE